MDGQVIAAGPFNHVLIKGLERMANIHQQYEALETLAFAQVASQLLLPLLFDLKGDLGEAISGQIDQARMVIHGKEINQLGAARGFAGSCQLVLGGQCIDAAGLSSIGSTCKGYLGPLVGGALLELAGARQEAG